MPEGRLKRTREAYRPSLDGASVWLRTEEGRKALRRGLSALTPPVTGPGSPWRAPHLNAAERLERQAYWLKPWAEALADRAVDWNVIEGEHTTDCPVCGMAMWTGGETPECVSPYCRGERFTADRDLGDEG